MLKIAVVGLGYWGTNILRNFCALDSVGEVLVYDINSKRMNEAKNNFFKVRGAKSLEEVLGSDVQAVVIATSPLSTHYQLGKLVLDAGKHLWLEKPLAASTIEAHDLIKMANSKNVKLHVDHTFCYASSVNGIKNILDRKELGQVKHVSMTRVNILSPKTKEDVFWDLAYHDLYLLFYWFGCQFQAKEFHGQHILKNDFRNHGHIFLESSLGMTADIKVSFVGSKKIRQVSIFGDQKILFYDDLDKAAAVKTYDLASEMFADKPEFNDNQEPLLTEIKHFVDCINQNIESETSGLAALNVIKLLESIS